MKKIVFGAVLALVSFAAAAFDKEVFTSFDRVRWFECGTNGCWRQPPLPYKFDLKTHGWRAGARLGEIEIAYEDHGKASVDGTFVTDDNYDSPKAKVREGSPTVHARASQTQTGLSVAWTPRAESGGMYLQPAIGLLYYEQVETIQWLDAKGAVYQEGTLHNRGHVTPMLGLEVGVAQGPVRVGVGARAYWRPRYRDSVAGGGEEHTVGMITWGATLRYAF
jgi:hypothetical protein